MGASAVPAHLGHGDTLGPCPEVVAAAQNAGTQEKTNNGKGKGKSKQDADADGREQHDDKPEHDCRRAAWRSRQSTQEAEEGAACPVERSQVHWHRRRRPRPTSRRRGTATVNANGGGNGTGGGNGNGKANGQDK